MTEKAANIEGDHEPFTVSARERKFAVEKLKLIRIARTAREAEEAPQKGGPLKSSDEQ